MIKKTFAKSILPLGSNTQRTMTMKKLLYMAVAAIAALSSCGDDVNDNLNVNPNLNPNDNGNANPNVDVPVFTATIEGEAGTRTQLVEGSTAGKMTKVEWLDTDEVMVFCMDNNEYFALLGKYSVTPGTPATTATLTPPQTFICKDPQTPQVCYAVYPASFSHASIDDLSTYTMAGDNGSNFVEQCLCNLALPATQTYHGADISLIAPMVAYYAGENMDNANLEFNNMTALLAITVKSADFNQVSSITVTADKKLNGDFQMLRAEDGTWSVEETNSEVTDAQKVLTLNCQNEGANTAIPAGESKTFYVSIPPQTYSHLQIDVTDGTSTKTMKTKAASITVARNKIYPIAFAKNYDPNLLAGKFSVSATKKVQFTKGNLQATYDVSGYTWGFAANQWDYLGGTGSIQGNTSIDSQESGKIVDLFGWSTSNTNYGINTSTSNPTYSGVFEDWGENFPGMNYFTLSKDEWVYLLNTANDASGARTQTNRFARAVVHSVYGLLIFPDNYNATTAGIESSHINNAGNLSSISTITDDTWTTMESAGVVFLPAAGLRFDYSIKYPGNDGYYWSSTAYLDDCAYFLEFMLGCIIPAAGNSRCYGRSVRLVSVASE